jgi:hypothetical protein
MVSEPKLMATMVWASMGNKLFSSGDIGNKALVAAGSEVGAFYWTVPAPDIVNSGREEQGLVSI